MNQIVDQNYILSSNILFGFFFKLFIAQLIYSITYYLLEKTIIYKINKIFNNLIKKIMYNNKLEYFNNNNNKINKLWLYLNNEETYMGKMLLELPKIITFISYYFYIIKIYFNNIIFLLLPLNLLIIYFINPITKQQHKYQNKQINLNIKIKNKMLETMNNIEFVKLNNKELEEFNNITILHSKYQNNKRKDRKNTTYLSFVSETVSDMIIHFLCIFGIPSLINNSIKPIDLLFIAIHTGNFYYNIFQLKEIYKWYYEDYSIINGIFNEFINNKVLIKKNTINNAIQNNHLNKNNIIFDNLKFSYDNHNYILKNLSFIFELNKINILIGPNGSGKRTIIKLLLRLYELENGNIFYKGKNICMIPTNNIRKKITFVQREPIILNDTILNNIIYGNESINKNKLMQMCDLLELKKWLIENQNKITGFNGTNLIGSDRKKIQLINAISKDSKIIIFDEPSNSLDINAMQWFIDFIKKLKDIYSKTIIIITHDKRLIELGDHIVNIGMIKN